MAVFPPSIQELMPWDNLQDFIDDFTKGMQILADSIYDPDDDNQHERFIPHTYGSISFYARFCVRDLLTDAYSNNLLKDYGQQEWLIGGTLSIHGVTPAVTNVAVLGKMNQNNHWSNFTDAEKEYVDGLMNDWMSHDNKIYCVNEKSPALVDLSSDYSDQYSVRYIVHPSGYVGDYLKFYFYSLITDDYVSLGNQKLWFYPETFTTETIDGYQYLKPVGRRPVDIFDIVSGTWDCYYGQPYVGTVKTATEAQNYVTRNGSQHNYTKNYTGGDGDDFTVYYGDNYIIYVIDDGDEVSYDDLYNVTVQVTPDIDPDIHVPTYDENKYGPEPPEPPEPTDEDDIDDQVVGAGANLGSIARLWVLTRQQLIDLHDAFTSAPANYDPLTSFIGVLGFGVQPIKVVGDSLPWTLNPINIRMSNGELWHTGVEAHIVDTQVSAFSFPDIHIKKRYNNFLDYSPYATHEIFIPMCGWLTLPDIAVDRTISVTYLPDLESMRCRAVVSVVDDDGDKCVIGVKDGIMGAEVPFSNLNHSVWLANLITNAADVTGEIVTGAIGAGFTKNNAKGGTYRPYEGFTIGMAGTLPGAVGNALLSGNVNRTHVVGSNGNRTGFSDGECVMIKSTYHKIDKPDNYDHTIGKVCNKTGQLSEFHGFTVCDNPHINISALDAEKEEIKRLLEEGVILPSGE